MIMRDNHTPAGGIMGHNHMAGRGIMAKMPAPRAPPAA